MIKHHLKVEDRVDVQLHYTQIKIQSERNIQKSYRELCFHLFLVICILAYKNILYPCMVVTLITER